MNKAVPRGIYLSERGTKEELINSEPWTGVGLGVHRITHAEEGQVEEVISGCVESCCVLPKPDYIVKYTRVQ